MPSIIYVPKKFRGEAIQLIAHARVICGEYAAQGYDLTLRQLYYQYVARDLIPNSQKSYKLLGSIINDARMAGLLDWDFIVDRTRKLEELAHWDSPGEIVDAIAHQYRIPKWEDQPYYVEAWVEKASRSSASP